MRERLSHTAFCIVQLNHPNPDSTPLKHYQSYNHYILETASIDFQKKIAIWPRKVTVSKTHQQKTAFFLNQDEFSLGGFQYSKNKTTKFTDLFDQSKSDK